MPSQSGTVWYSQENPESIWRCNWPKGKSDKSSITFGSKVPENVHGPIKVLTAIQNERGAGTYLGLPEYFSGSKTKMLDFIFDRLKSKLSG